MSISIIYVYLIYTCVLYMILKRIFVPYSWRSSRNVPRRVTNSMTSAPRSPVSPAAGVVALGRNTCGCSWFLYWIFVVFWWVFYQNVSEVLKLMIKTFSLTGFSWYCYLLFWYQHVPEVLRANLYLGEKNHVFLMFPTNPTIHFSRLCLKNR